MVQANVKKRNISLVLLCAVALIWGAGFVFTDQLLTAGFAPTPGLQNALRFGIGTILLAILLWKDIKITGKNLLYGLIGGSLLFTGFMFQLVGQTYITPAHCGFFTALYFVMTPFISWIVYKKAPNAVVFVAVALAAVGLAVLNVGQMPTHEETLGTILTIIGATMFAIQIVYGDYLLKSNKIESNNLVVLQLVVASLLFVLYTLIFESKNYATLNINFGKAWWMLTIVSLLGTGFAYYSQTYAQKFVSPSQTSLILACETPIGAIISVIIGLDQFNWNILIGGALVVISVFIIEFAPILLEKLQNKKQSKPNDK